MIRINRNIVECKDGSIIFSVDMDTVLIETLWNVKSIPTPGIPCGPGINRNIVECKVGYIFRGILSGCTY